MIHSYLRILACVARADNVIVPEEFSAIDGVLVDVVDERIAEEVRSILDVSKPFDVDAVLRDCVSEILGSGANEGTIAANLAEVVRDCYVIASVDGELTLAESTMIDRVMALAGLPDDRRPNLHRWANLAAKQTLKGAAMFLESLASSHESANQ